MRRADFGYDLPPELIAQEPRPRGESRMMIVEPSDGPPGIRHALVSAFPSLLRAGDLLVLNNTKVFPARLFAGPKGNMKRPVELLLTRHLTGLEWQAWCRPARRIRVGDILHFSEQLQAEVIAKGEGSIAVRFEMWPDIPMSGIAREEMKVTTSVEVDREEQFWEELERLGQTPLPPYIRRPEPSPADRESYQTVYASRRGAVAAPTAGLHFTRHLLDECIEQGAKIAEITLHVGLGTFAPMKADSISEHVMHSEELEIDAGAAALIEETRRSRGRVIAVGTTVVRALESAAAGGREIEPSSGETSIFITPGYRFQVVDALLTNFHLPESTLLMLVSAFAGMETIRSAYQVAIEERYRFFSYGDCMFLASRGGF